MSSSERKWTKTSNESNQQNLLCCSMWSYPIVSNLLLFVLHVTISNFARVVCFSPRQHRNSYQLQKGLDLVGTPRLQHPPLQAQQYRTQFPPKNLRKISYSLAIGYFPLSFHRLATCLGWSFWAFASSPSSGFFETFEASSAWASGSMLQGSSCWIS